HDPNAVCPEREPRLLHLHEKGVALTPTNRQGRSEIHLSEPDNWHEGRRASAPRTSAALGYRLPDVLHLPALCIAFRGVFLRVAALLACCISDQPLQEAG